MDVLLGHLYRVWIASGADSEGGTSSDRCISRVAALAGPAGQDRRGRAISDDDGPAGQGYQPSIKRQNRPGAASPAIPVSFRGGCSSLGPAEGQAICPVGVSDSPSAGQLRVCRHLLSSWHVATLTGQARLQQWDSDTRKPGGSSCWSQEGLDPELVVRRKVHC